MITSSTTQSTGPSTGPSTGQSAADVAISPLIRDLAVSQGTPVASAANQPITLDDTSLAYFVVSGAVDVFLFEQVDGVTRSSARHMTRADAGQLIFGIGEHDAPLAAVCKGLPGAELVRLPCAALAARELSQELAEQVDRWINAIGGAIASRIEPRPRPTLVVELADAAQSDSATPAAAALPMSAGAADVLSTRAGAVVWIRTTRGEPAFLGTEEPAADGGGLAPLSFDTWLTLSQDTELETVGSRELAASGALLSALGEFHALAISAEQLNRLLLQADVVNEQTAREALRRRDADQARDGLNRILDREPAAADQDGSALMAALELIGDHEGLRFQPPAQQAGLASEEPRLDALMRSSGVRARQIRLQSEDRWWLGDSGAMLGFLGSDGSPVALLPHWSGRYRMVNPRDGRTVRINADNAAALAADAWLCYPALPKTGSVGALELARIARHGLASSFGRFALAGLLAALLSQAPAIAIGVLTDWVLASAAGDILVQVMIALLAFAVVGVLLQILQGTSMMRIEGRAAARVSAAAWDRLLTLPPSFFRRFTAGELAIRMATFQLMRDQLSGVVANALLSFVFLMPSLAILFVYDITLALVSVGLAAGTILVTAMVGLWQLIPQRRGFAAERRLAGELLQFIGGISKLRGAGAEPSAFAAWARHYREQHLAGIQVSRLNEHLLSFSAAMPALIGAALFAVALARGPDQLQVSDFLVVYAVAMTFFAAAATLGRSFEAIAATLPGYEQIKPVLEALPEPGAHSSAQITLQGEVRFDHVSFRYEPDTPLLDDVTIAARAGEFIAIVGESGSGKSTLMRLALGLEDPTSGSVYYDGRDLASLDRQALRRQLGVVMQDGALQPGSLLDNVIGMGDDLDIEDAWRAVAQADIEDEIAQMPMQLYTVVTEGAATFSGGQTQRLRIAAALVRNPRIVWLDEATSWLDARSQAQVMQSIERLAATRIVIAHRLSTIRHADRIYVMQRGRVVQVGDFDELYAAPGPFRQLVERQLA